MARGSLLGAGAMSIVGESVKRINDEYLCAAGAEAQEKRHKLGESAVRELVD